MVSVGALAAEFAFYRENLKHLFGPVLLSMYMCTAIHAKIGKFGGAGRKRRDKKGDCDSFCVQDSTLFRYERCHFGTLEQLEIITAPCNEHRITKESKFEINTASVQG